MPKFLKLYFLGFINGPPQCTEEFMYNFGNTLQMGYIMVYEFLFLAEEDTLAILLRNVDTLDPKQKTLTNSKQVHKSTDLPDKFPSMNSDNQSTLTNEDTDTQRPIIFEGLRFVVSGFTQKEQQYIKDTIESLGGEVVSKSYR